MNTIANFFLSISVGTLALFLRLCHGNPVRQWVTLNFGFEGRALLEHFFAAIAIPLICATYMHLCFSWPSGRTVHSPSIHCRIVAWLSAHVGLVLATVFGFVYFSANLVFEWNQAFVSVYGASARGYIQWTQIGTNLAGCIVACLLSIRRVELDVSSS
ncbi:hypothetical protein LPN04_29635 [Rugamonas sp. A1-17]|nr:hypothetical protein [Rugamonas sp. A1-17]